MPITDITSFRNMLRIDKHRLDDELEIQGEMMEHISQNLTTATSRVAEAKEQLEREEASIYKEAKEDNPKATVAELQGTVQRDKERVILWQKFQRARHEHEEWQGLYEAWKARGFALRALADLQIAGYYTSSSAYGSHKGEQSHEQARKQVVEARKSQGQEGVQPRRRTLVD